VKVLQHRKHSYYPVFEHMHLMTLLIQICGVGAAPALAFAPCSISRAVGRKREGFRLTILQ
jgi:hypothetical protein